MQIGVYGSGYLGTVISACLADFGTPVSCCHPDRTRMVEMAQGNIPFFEKNLKEIIRRNVRAGRLAYSTDIESFARKTQVIFLAEDGAENLTDVVMRIARLAAKPPILTIVTPVAVGTVAALCERVGADAVSLALALGLDKKIAPRCLQPGAGMGGVFAESDMDSLAQLAQANGVPLKVLGAAREVNHTLADRLVEKIALALNSVENKDVGILGLAFKPNTNSVAGSSAVRLAETLVAKGARVRAYDPVALTEAKTRLNGSVRYCESAYAAAEGMDALVVGTGWPEFRALDFERIKHLLKKPVIVDTKNLLDSVRLRALGFEYVGVGRG